MCSCSQKSNISNLPTASLCCAGSITYKCIGKIQNMKVYLYRPQFENVHFLWVNNASTSFFTHFYSINFIYTSYFAWNYFIFTSYMKYFRLWSFSIVTELSPHLRECSPGYHSFCNWVWKCDNLPSQTRLSVICNQLQQQGKHALKSKSLSLSD